MNLRVLSRTSRSSSVSSVSNSMKSTPLNLMAMVLCLCHPQRPFSLRGSFVSSLKGLGVMKRSPFGTTKVVP